MPTKPLTSLGITCLLHLAETTNCLSSIYFFLPEKNCAFTWGGKVPTNKENFSSLPSNWDVKRGCWVSVSLLKDYSVVSILFALPILFLLPAGNLHAIFRAPEAILDYNMTLRMEAMYKDERDKEPRLLIIS